MKKAADYISLALSAIPLLTFSTLVILAAYVRLRLGHWPTGRDHLDVSLFLNAFEGEVLIVVYGFPVWLVTTGWLAIERRFRTVAWRAAAFFPPLIVLFVAVRYDPTTFSEWLFG